MDDALDLLLAMCSPEFNILGITCVNGSILLDKVVIKTLKVIEHLGKQVPVYAGAIDPLISEKSQNTPAIHNSSDGQSNLDYSLIYDNFGKNRIWILKTVFAFIRFLLVKNSSKKLKSNPIMINVRRDQV